MTWTISAFADEAGGSTEDQIAALKRAGLKYLDPRSIDGSNIAVIPLDKAQASAKKLAAAGVTVQMYGSPLGKIDVADDLQIDLDKLSHIGKLKDVFGCNKVRIFSYYNKKANLDHKKWQTEALDRLSRLNDLAQKLGLVLYHENETDIFGDRAEDCMVIADKLRGESFKMIYDFANYIRTKQDGWTTWQICKNATDCFHLKDQKNNGEHVPLGGGEDTHIERILRDVKATGWQGPASVEPHLTHSTAVASTGVHGSGDKALKDMPPADTFHIACEAATAMLKKVGIKFE